MKTKMKDHTSIRIKSITKEIRQAINSQRIGIK